MHLYKPYRRSIILSLLCIISAITIVCLIVLISIGSGGIEKSSFKRKFASSKPIMICHSDKISGLRAICGINDRYVYFETDTVGHIIETDSMLSLKRLIKFQIPYEKTVSSLYTTFIDSAYVFIMAGNLPGIMKISLKDSTYQLLQFPGNLFSEAVAVGSGKFVLRVYQQSKNHWDQVFSKWDPLKKEIITNKNITGKEGDAGISTDGMLLYDKRISRIVYVPYYNNQFFCIDTFLNVLYQKRMIYTLITPLVKVRLENRHYSKVITNSSPLYEVNHKSKARNNRLYINSAISADNESSEFYNNAVLDVYRISDGQYLGSFYIPKYKKEKLKDFEVTGNKIIVLYKNYIVTYSIPSMFNRSDRS